MKKIIFSLFLGIMLISFEYKLVEADDYDYPVSIQYNQIEDEESVKRNFSMAGDTEYKSPWYILTYDQPSKAGSVYLNNKIQLSQDFESTGTLGILYRAVWNADGLGVVFHTGEVDQIGEKGEGLGIVGLPNAIGMVIRTFQGPNDPEAVPYAAIWTTDQYGSKKVIRTVPISLYSGFYEQWNELKYSFRYNSSSKKLNFQLWRSNKPIFGENGYDMDVPSISSEYAFSITASTGDKYSQHNVKIDKSRLAFYFTNKPVITGEYVKDNIATLYLKDENGLSYPKGSIVYINGGQGIYIGDNSSVEVPIDDMSIYNNPLDIKVKSFRLVNGEKKYAEVSKETEYALTPKMQLETKPTNISIYNNYKEDINTKYYLSNIPSSDDYGEIEIIYSNETKSKMNFNSNLDKVVSGSIEVPRKTLPETLNDLSGSIKSYDVKVQAKLTSETLYKYLPSNNYTFQINVYNLGAQPNPQTISKNSTWTKSAESLLKDPVILPGHKASYEYVSKEKPVDTSKEGFQYVDVRMTDTDDPVQSKVIRVPVLIYDGSIPTGLVIGANNIEGRSAPFRNLTEDQRKSKILELSEATAWDTSTGSTDGVSLTVETTNLPERPTTGTYSATLKAQKQGKTPVTKQITIKIQDDQVVTIAFENKIGQPVHDSISYKRPIGSTIDLSKDEAVQKAIKEIEQTHYQLSKKPENETAIPVKEEESIVKYAFSGTLTVESSPNYLNFGRKRLNTPFIKVEKATYDQPLVIWDNREDSQPWRLMVTLKEPLTLEGSDKTLPNALRYKVDKDNVVALSKNNTQEIALRTNSEKGAYELSKEWEKGESGFQLEIPANQVLEEGKYRATLLWNLVSAP